MGELGLLLRNNKQKNKGQQGNTTCGARGAALPSCACVCVCVSVAVVLLRFEWGVRGVVCVFVLLFGCGCVCEFL